MMQIENNVKKVDRVSVIIRQQFTNPATPSGTVVLTKQLQEVYGMKVQYFNVSPSPLLNDDRQGSLYFLTSERLGPELRREAFQLANNSSQSYPMTNTIGVTAAINSNGTSPFQTMIGNYPTKLDDTDVNACREFFNPINLQTFDWAVSSYAPIQGLTSNYCVEIIITFYCQSNY